MSETGLSRQTVARFAGLVYLLQMASAIFGEVFVRGRVLVRGDAAATATNLVASARLWRIGVVSDLLTYVLVVVLLWALYVVLAPVDRPLALLAAFLRLVENSILAVVTVGLMAALLPLGGAGSAISPSWQGFDVEQSQMLARLSIGVWVAGFRVGMVFLGFGSALFSYLWLRSRYIPRALAAWGIFASLLLALGTLLFMVDPDLGTAVGLAYMMPMGVYEIGLGLWLLVKGIRLPAAA